jgi:protoporphyrinogen oxidase
MNWWQDILPLEQSAFEDQLEISYQNAHRPLIPTAAVAHNPDATMLVRQRLSRIFYRRRFFDYPLKLSARTLGNLGVGSAVAIGASYMAAKARPRTPEVTLEDFLINRFGDRLYRTFFKSYTEKVWGVPCDRISAEWGAQRIKGLSVTRAITHALRGLLPKGSGLAQREVETSLIERFLYPKFGPGQMWEEVAGRVTTAGGEIHLQHRIVGIRREGSRVTGVDVLDLGTQEVRHVPCRHLVSSMPVGDLVRQLGPETPELERIATGLPHRDFMTAGLLLKKMRHGGGGAAVMPPDNWIYVQEDDVRLGRIQIFNNWSPYLVRDANTVWLGLEYFCNAGDDLWAMNDGRFIDFAAAELAKIGLADRADVLDGTVVRVPKAYPAYFGDYDQMPTIRNWLNQFENVFPIGRNGMHRYNNQDHSMLAGREAVDCIAENRSTKDALWAINTEEDYHEERESRSGND